MKKILVFDMDNVICDLQNVWLALYNKLYNDHARKEDIKGYDIHNYVKYGPLIYKLIENDHVFRRLPPLPDAIDGLKYLMQQGHKVQICSAAEGLQIEGKLDWLRFYLPEIKQEDIFFTMDKSIMEADFMFDDAPHNLYTSSCRTPVLFSQPWNRNCKDFITVHNWKEIIRLVEHQ